MMRSVLRRFSFLAALATSSTLGAHTNPVRPPVVTDVPVQAVTAADLQEPSVMIVEFERKARFIGFPSRCPGSSEDVNPEEEICMAELYQERAQRIRHISGPVLPRRFLLRTTAHSAHVLLRPGSRIIVAVKAFEDKETTGQFAFWWQPEDENKRICLTEKDIAELNAGPAFRSARRKRYQNGYTGEVIWSRCLIA
jgi:hypothetical protein